MVHGKIYLTSAQDRTCSDYDFNIL